MISSCDKIAHLTSSPPLPRGRAIVTELGKLGAEVEEGRDYCIITPPETVNSGVAIDTYDDHRMVSYHR